MSTLVSDMMMGEWCRLRIPEKWDRALGITAYHLASRMFEGHGKESTSREKGRVSWCLGRRYVLKQPAEILLYLRFEKGGFPRML